MVVTNVSVHIAFDPEPFGTPAGPAPFSTRSKSWSPALSAEGPRVSVRHEDPLVGVRCRWWRSPSPWPAPQPCWWVVVPTALGAPPGPVAVEHPTFAASYLSGVSGPQPERVTSLAGTWSFIPITNTVCVGGGPFGATTGPFLSCTDTPARAVSPRRSRSRAGDGSKQGWTDLSRGAVQPHHQGADDRRANR